MRIVEKANRLANIGEEFEQLTVIGAPFFLKRQATYRRSEQWAVVECRCGVVSVLPLAKVVHGQTKSCGCLKRRTGVQVPKTKRLVEPGSEFELLTVIGVPFYARGLTPGRPTRQQCVVCECQCGCVKVVVATALINGRATSCRCNNPNQRAGEQSTGFVHGMTGTRLFVIWGGMKARCGNPEHASWSRYGGRGIRVCDEWQDDFPAFMRWAMANGYGDSLTIDRVDNDGDYQLDNCEWVPLVENIRRACEYRKAKRRVTHG